MHVTIIVPVLNRPHRVAPLVESIAAATSDPYEVVFACTAGDDVEINTVDRTGHRWFTLPWAPGDFARKVNTAFRHSASPFVFTAADDLRFHPGWFQAAKAQMKAGIGVVGTNDLGNRRVLAGRHATHNLIRRAYIDEHGTIDEPGKVFHEGYEHNFCDNELVGTARRRKAWAFAPDSVVEHLHPSWEKAEWDDTYELSRVGWERDRALFKAREPLWT